MKRRLSVVPKTFEKNETRCLESSSIPMEVIRLEDGTYRLKGEDIPMKITLENVSGLQIIRTNGEKRYDYVKQLTVSVKGKCSVEKCRAIHFRTDMLILELCEKDTVIQGDIEILELIKL